MTDENSRINSRNAQVIQRAFDVLRGNRFLINGHSFTIPSRTVESDDHLDYDGKQWLWDSAFHAMILASQDGEMAKDELRSVFACQHRDGFVPHMNYFRGDAGKVPDWAKPHFENFCDSPEGSDITGARRNEFINTYWSYQDHSDITQPPVLAVAVETVMESTNDAVFLGEMLPRLKKYYDYLHQRRDSDRDGLISIIHPWESGWDNSQRWDLTLGVADGERSHIDNRKMRLISIYKKLNWNLDRIFELDEFNVEPVDFNVIYAVNMTALARLCRRIGDTDGADVYENRADKTRRAIFQKMWDGDKYTDLCTKDEIKSPVKSAAMFYPMILPGEEHHRHLIEKHLANPAEFNLTRMVPTTSRDHDLYDGSQYWRGNIWININWFLWNALMKVIRDNPDYHPAKLMAHRIKESSFELLAKSGFFEYFNPETDDGYGVKNFAWNGLVRFMDLV